MSDAPNRSKRMLMLGGWNPLYQKAKQAGFELTVVQEKTKVKPEDFLLVDDLITLPLDHPDLPELATLLHKTRPFDCVVSFNEVGLLSAALIREKLQIQGNPLRPVLLTRNKLSMREHLQQQGLPTIPHRAVSTVEEAIAFGKQCGWPIILKPTMGMGSMQIHKVESEAGVQAALSSIQSADPKADVLAEKYVVGPEVSVEGVSLHGVHHVINVTDKRTTGAPFFVEVGHSVPTSLTVEQQEQIREMTVAFLTSIGHQTGPSHTEMIVTAAGPLIIESHTRAGGDFIYELTEYGTGVDVFKLTFEALAGQEPSVQVGPQKAAAIRYLTLPDGTVRRVQGIEEAQQIDGIMRCQILLREGQEIASFTNSTERYGWILARGETLDDVVHRLDQAFQTIQVEME